MRGALVVGMGCAVVCRSGLGGLGGVIVCGGVFVGLWGVEGEWGGYVYVSLVVSLSSSCGCGVEGVGCSERVEEALVA